VLLRQVLLGASRNERLRAVVENAPVSRSVVARYVAGDRTEDAVRAARELVDEGLMVTIDYLGEYTTDQTQAEQKAQAYLTLLAALDAAGLTSKAEVSVKLSAVGQALPTDGEKIALDHARVIAAAARAAGTTMTLDMEDHTTTESTLRILRELRQEFPETGAVLQAMLRRTEADCRELAYEGSRVRLCKGAYDEPVSVAYTDVKDIDHSYVRCLRILMSSPGYPMVATHDPRLIAIAVALATRFGREKGSYEFQLLHGVRPQEQRRLASTGEKVRVYLPYGEEWYGYLVRRLAERPANMSLFLRSLVSSS
jgi:proline dehydrogenase